MNMNFLLQVELEIKKIYLKYVIYLINIKYCLWIRKKCYAIGEYEATDTLYNIFDKIFENEVELEEFLKKYSKR